jgi:hypothetical protein
VTVGDAAELVGNSAKKLSVVLPSANGSSSTGRFASCPMALSLAN